MLYLLAVGCQHITGPFRWDSAEVTISGVSDEMSYLRDQRVGFELQHNGGIILYYGSWEGGKNDFYIDPTEEPESSV